MYGHLELIHGRKIPVLGETRKAKGVYQGMTERQTRENQLILFYDMLHMGLTNGGEDEV
jgi:hypothetical protein